MGREVARRRAHLGCAAVGSSRRSWLARSGLVRAFMRARCSSCLACSWRGLSSSSCPGTKALQGRISKK